MNGNRKGVTLVEVLVASLILVISISGVLYLFAENQKMIIRDDKIIIAYKLLNNNLERLNNFQDKNAFITYVNENSMSIDSVATVDEKLEQYITKMALLLGHVSTNANWGTGLDYPHLKTVKVTVSWGKPQQSVSKVLISKPSY